MSREGDEGITGMDFLFAAFASFARHSACMNKSSAHNVRAVRRVNG